MFHCDSKLPEDSDSAVIFQAIPTIGIDQLDPKSWDFSAKTTLQRLGYLTMESLI